jgi:hypothetical protein
MEIGGQTPFAELPEALVEDMLSKSEQVGEELFNSFREIQEKKEKMRKQLQDENMLKKDTDLGYPGIPTTCGIDGSYAVERLLSTDLTACAAVAVEGLTPPSEKRHWQKPHHLSFIQPVKHNPDTETILRGLMFKMEIKLATEAPHDIVFLDGSLATPLIRLNQAINKILKIGDTPIGNKVAENFEEFLDCYKTILKATRSDKLWVGLPKYTTNREIGEEFSWPPHYDDRAVLTTILNSGEFTTPVLLKQSNEPWHLKLPSGDINRDFDDIIKRLHVLYYKPQSWTPTLRVEISSSVATNNSRVAVLLQGLKYQCGTPGIMEPYPLYMADRMVKHLSGAIPAFRQTATRRMAELHQGDIGDIFFSMHGYRTESGK